MGNIEARQVATGEYPDGGSSSYRTSAVAPEAMAQLNSNSLAGVERHTVKEPTDLEAG